MQVCGDCRYYKDGYCFRHPPVWKPESRPQLIHPQVSASHEACGDFKPDQGSE